MALKLEYMRDELIKMYESGKSITAISKEIGEYEQAIRNVLIGHTEIRHRKDYEFDCDYFEKIDSEDKAYFLGFIAADGALVDNGRGVLVLSISINEKDVMVLEKLKEHMKAEHPIKQLARNQVRITITRKKLASDLMKLGIHERKSLDLEPMLSVVPKPFKKDFIRGYFDGDGSIFMTTTGSKNPRHYVGIRGTEDFLKEFSDYTGIKGSLKFSSGTHQWRFGAKADIIKFRDLIYDNSTIYLSRKKEKFPW